MTTGAKIKAIMKVGFNTIGSPNVNGSEILKQEGATNNFIVVLNRFDFAIKMILANAMPSTSPQSTKTPLKVLVKIFGNA